MGKTGLWRQEQPARERQREKERKGKRWEAGRAILKWNVVNVHTWLLVAAAEGVSCQNLKGRCLNANTRTVF